jgi:hypothetical protein
MREDTAVGELSLQAIHEAQARIAGRVSRTPMFSSRTAARLIGDRTGVALGAGPAGDGTPRLFVKAEHLQVTGSFKPRGATNKVLTLSEDERARVLARLGARVSEDGTVRVVASDSRSQRQNRDRAEARLADLIRRALAVQKARRRTRTPRAAVEARLDQKRRQTERKRQRRWKGDE